MFGHTVNVMTQNYISDILFDNQELNLIRFILDDLWIQNNYNNMNNNNNNTNNSFQSQHGTNSYATQATTM
jgi:hypothetical protein